VTHTSDSFSADYAEARDKFRAAAKDAGGALEAIGHPEPGAEGEALSTDVAWFGPRDAAAAIVLISATHGVEGFCGSGAQVDLLTRGEIARLPAGMAVLMIHGVNPYGFSWLRRVTHENVDLNRNWIDFDAALPENPGYDTLADAACPPNWSEESVASSARALVDYIKERGAAALQHALSGGQHKHPKGIFYGGLEPTWSRRTQTAILTSYLANTARVGVIDYHTGLGPWGYGERIVTDAPGSPGFARAATWWGAGVTSPSGGTSTSAPITGDGLSAIPRLLPDAEVTSMAIEVGTRPLEAVMTAVRADNWLHAHGDLGSEQGRAIKAQIRDAFYGDTDDWKGMVAGQSLLAFRQAVAGIQG
jgi:hypothetical protein